MITLFSLALVKDKERRIAIPAGQKLFGMLGLVLTVPAVTIVMKVVVIFLEDSRNRAVPSEALQHSHEIIV